MLQTNFIATPSFVTLSSFIMICFVLSSLTFSKEESIKTVDKEATDP